MTRWVRWVANDYYFSLDTVIIKEDLANLFQGKQKSACLGFNGDPPNLKQNWIQGWHIRQRDDLFKVNISANKIRFPQGQSYTEKEY